MIAYLSMSTELFVYTTITYNYLNRMEREILMLGFLLLELREIKPDFGPQI
jgi:hypothetical protein